MKKEVCDARVLEEKEREGHALAIYAFETLALCRRDSGRGRK
jgi:hypothetical protein